MADLLSQAVDLPSFRVVAPNRAIRPDDLKLPDSTPMIGPDGLLVPPGRSFNMIVNSATRVYSYRFDEAMRDNFVQARAMRRDGFILGLFEERILPTINREWQLEIDDEGDENQAMVRDALSRVVKAIPDFDAYKRANLDGVWFGRAGTQWGYTRLDEVDRLWGLSRWDPLHGDSVQFTFDGYPAILLDSMTAGWYSEHGATWGPNGDLRPTDRGGTALVLHRPYWRDRFAIHVHMRQKADYFEGELAGSVQGLGLRGQIYWQYIVRTDALTWMLAYMQAVGQMDLLVFNYPTGNATAQATQEANAQKVIGKAAIACPRNPTQNWPAIEQIPMNAAGLKALHDLVSDYFDRHIERLIVGQSMSSGADNKSGLGGTGRAEFAKACVPTEGSEILTRSGFKSPHDAVVGEDVLAYDAETDRCRWTPLLKKSFYEDCAISRMFNGQNKFEAVCTPDHSWAVEKTMYASDRRSEYIGDAVEGPRGATRLMEQKRYLKKAFEISTRENIILAAPEDGTETSLLTPTEAAILGWVITDGTIRKIEGKFSGTRYSVGICQSKEECFEPIRELVGGFIGGYFHESVSETKSRTFPMNGKTYVTKPQHWWWLPRNAGTDLLKKCGFRSRSDLPGIVTQLSSPSRQSMLEAMMMADGHTGKQKVFTNTDPYVMEAFEILCVLEGRATGKARPKKRDPQYSECFDKTIKSNRYAYGNYIQMEDAGRADVWCPTTQYGTWVMRQNGRVMITGNTKDEILVYDTGRLDQTLTRDLIAPLKRYNFPWAKFPVRFKSVMPDLDASDKTRNGEVLIRNGVSIRVDEWREAAGFSRPEEGDEVIGGQIPGQAPPGMDPNAPGGGMPLGPGGPPAPGGAPLPPPMMNAGGGQPAGGSPPAIPPTPNSAAGPNQVPRNPYSGRPVVFEGGAPVSGPAMGFPGGGNTYLPRREKEEEIVGFTRYANPESPSTGKRKYGCVMLKLTGEAAAKIQEMSQKIEDADLGEDGREEDPHVTIRFGLHDNDPEPVERILAGSGKVKIKLTKVDAFLGESSGKDYDVIKVTVESPQLRLLNHRLGALPHTDTHAEYSPHATIAYVKKGLAGKYLKQFPALDLTCEESTVVFSDAEKNKTTFSLTKKPTEYRRPTHYFDERRAAQELADLVTLMNEALGIDSPGDPAAVLEMLQTKNRVEYFDPNQPRAADGKWGSGGTSKESPSSELNNIPPRALERVKKFAGALKEKLTYWAMRATPLAWKAAGEIFDTPEDFKKVGFAPSVSGTAGPVTDPMRDQLGIGTHLACSIASRVLAYVLTKVKGRRTDFQRLPMEYASKAPSARQVIKKKQEEERRKEIMGTSEDDHHRREKEVWQGPSSRWFKLKKHHPVPTQDPTALLPETKPTTTAPPHLKTKADYDEPEEPERPPAQDVPENDPPKPASEGNSDRLPTSPSGPKASRTHPVHKPVIRVEGSPQPEPQSEPQQPPAPQPVGSRQEQKAAARPGLMQWLNELPFDDLQAVFDHHGIDPLQSGASQKLLDALQKTPEPTPAPAPPPAGNSALEAHNMVLGVIGRNSDEVGAKQDLVDYLQAAGTEDRNAVLDAYGVDPNSPDAVDELFDVLRGNPPDLPDEQLVEFEPEDPTPTDWPEQNRQRRDYIQKAVPVNVEPVPSANQGANDSYILTFEDGSRGVYKPRSGERLNLRRGQMYGTAYLRERAFSDAADLLGFGDLVPATGIRRDGNDYGSIQSFAEGAKQAGEFHPDQMYDGEKDAARVAVLDYILGHSDRHMGNWMVAPSGKLVLIDNGCSLPDRYPDYRLTGLDLSDTQMKVGEHLSRMSPEDMDEFFAKYGVNPSSPTALTDLVKSVHLAERRDYFNWAFWSRAKHKDLKVPDEVRYLPEKWDAVTDSLRRNGISEDAIALATQRLQSVVQNAGRWIGHLPAFWSPYPGETLAHLV